MTDQDPESGVVALELKAVVIRVNRKRSEHGFHRLPIGAMFGGIESSHCRQTFLLPIEVSLNFVPNY